MDLIIQTPYAVSAVLILDNFFFVNAEHPASEHDAKAAKGELGCDQLFIIWSVTNNLTARFQDIYMLEEKLTTDKTLRLF